MTQRFALIALLLLAAPATAQKVEAVRFPGAHALPTSLLRETVETHAPACRSPFYAPFCALTDWSWAKRRASTLDRAVVAQDAERLVALYHAWGFPAATVEPVIVPERGDKVAVDFRIHEGRPILVDSVVVNGLNTLSPPVEVPRPLPLRAGEPYATPRLDATESLLRAAFAERGHPFAAVTVSGNVNEAARRAVAVLDVEPGPAAVFGQPRIQTEPPIRRKDVRERLTFRPGQPFRLSELQRSAAALRATPIIAKAEVVPVAVPADTVVPIDVTVTAAKRSAVNVDATLSSARCVELATYWRDRYFLGAPRVLSLGAGVANLFTATANGLPCGATDQEAVFQRLDWFGRADLEEPWPGDPLKGDLLFSVFGLRESSPYVSVRSGFGGRFGVRRAINTDLAATVAYAPARYQFSGVDVYTCGLFGDCGEGATSPLGSPNWLSPLSLEATWAPPGAFAPLRKPVVNPATPWVAPVPYPWRRWAHGHFEAAGAPTGSGYHYARLDAEAAATRVLGTVFEIAAHVRGGVLTAGSEQLPPQLRFYAGGANDMRGVSPNLFGPKLLVVDSAMALDLGCTPVTGGCPADLVVGGDNVAVRPTGGNALVVGTIEARAWLGSHVQLAAFVDAGTLWLDLTPQAATPLPNVSSLVTPGVGVRLITPVGPFRLDVGYDPRGPVRFPILEQNPDGTLTRLGSAIYDPFTYDHPSGWTEFWRRLNLQIGMSQPF